MERPSATNEESPSATTMEAALAVPMPIPDKAMLRVVMSPSSPPYTADLMY